MYLDIFDSYSFKLFFKSRKSFWDKFHNILQADLERMQAGLDSM